MKGDRGMKMQPGDWIAKEDIRDEEHLERIREAVRAQGWDVHKHYGQYKRREGWPYLNLDDAGGLVWSTRSSGRRIDPADLLGVGHPAADILQQLAEEARVNPKPWGEFQRRVDPGEKWEDCRSLLSLCWHLANEEVRRRPRTIRIGECDVPVGIQKPPGPRTPYYVADPSAVNYQRGDYRWGGSSVLETMPLERGLIHLDPESAATHGRALASLTAQEEQSDD